MAGEESTIDMGPSPSGGGPNAPIEDSLERRLEVLLDSFADRFLKGERPSVTEYVQANPGLSQKLRELLPALEGLGQANRAPPGVAGGTAAVVPGAIHRLGEYRLVREIGRGGMGIVYEAVQESLDRPVALKVLPLHSLLGERYLERFRREARIAASLQHSGIVPVYGVGEDQGIHFFVMQI